MIPAYSGREPAAIGRRRFASRLDYGPVASHGPMCCRRAGRLTGPHPLDRRLAPAYSLSKIRPHLTAQDPCALGPSSGAVSCDRDADMERTIGKSVVAGVGLVVALLVGNAGLAYRNTRQLRDDASWVAHTHEVLDLTSDVLRSLVDAEP